MAKIRNPEKFAWLVLKKHFPFLLECAERDSNIVEDINQIGWLAVLSGSFKFRESYNACQRELYAFAKVLGFRRNKKNQWLCKEQIIDRFYERDKEE